MQSIEVGWKAFAAAAPYLLALLLAASVLAHALHEAARAFERFATTTAATWDDGLARRLVQVASVLVAGADWLVALLRKLMPLAPHRDDKGGPGPGVVLVLLALVAATSTVACGSSAALATPVQTIPQHVSLTLDASDGGTISIGGECGPESPPPAEESAAGPVAVAGDCGGGSVWLDARGGGATADTEQVGTVIRTAIDAALSAQVPIATGAGSASTGAMEGTSGPTRRASTPPDPSSGGRRVAPGAGE